MGDIVQSRRISTVFNEFCSFLQLCIPSHPGIEIELNYYIERSQKLENEFNQYKIMYENRVEEYLKLKKVEEGGLSERE